MRSRSKELILCLGYLAYRIIRFPIKCYWKVCKVKTSGTRVLITHEGSLLLVRHWYNGLWVMPGGGISKYEIPEQAAVREVEEETGLKIEQLEYLLGTYANDANGKNDTVYCFVARPGQKLLARRRFNLEISDYAWYGLTELPYGVSVATKRRITEFVEGHISEQVRQW